MKGNNQFTNPYTKEQKEWLLSFKNSDVSYTKIAELFNAKFNEDKSKGAIRYVCSEVLGFENRVKTPHKLNEEEIAFLRENHKGISRKELTKRFNEKFGTNISEQQIKGSCNLRGMKNGLTGKFGNRPEWKPWNIGLTKEEFYKHYGEGQVKENIRAMIRSNIKHKKGDIVMWHGQKCIIVKNATGDSDNQKSYSWKDRVVPLTRYVYEQHYGNIPKGYKVIAKDGNNNNYNIDNLILVSKQQIMFLAKNDMFGCNEITETMLDIYEVGKKIKELKGE